LSLEDLTRSVVEKFQAAANIKTVYGDPIEVRGKTIIPVAKVAYGFCAGSGKKTDSGETGGGSGGGIAVRPAGVLEITDEGTSFIPIGDRRKLLGAMFFGFLLGMAVAARLCQRD